MDVGPGWTILRGAGAIQSNQLQSSTSGTALQASSVSGYSDAAISVDVTLPGSGDVSAGLLLRVTDANTGWAAVFENDGSGLTVTLVQLSGTI